jgi:hypothetical protein
VSPNANSAPLPGFCNVIVGAVLPAVTRTLAVPVSPCGSVTVNVGE